VKFPNFFKFCAAIARFSKALATGQPILVKPGVERERLNECKKRDGDCYEAWSGQCQVCTCFIGVKTLLATEKCPRGHWKREIFRTLG
jgi:hypothetical protein